MYKFYSSSNLNVEKTLSAYLDAIGFLLDIPIYWTMSKSEYIAESKIIRKSENTSVLFRYIISEYEYDSTKGHYAGKELIKEAKINLRNIQEFILKVLTEDRLDDAIYHYQKAIEEPESFLVSLYRAYEILRRFDVFPKKQANDFRRLANHEPVWGSRHSTEEQNIGLRYLTSEEKKFCLETIKTGIVKFSDTIPI